jgi:hypothetical protein
MDRDEAEELIDFFINEYEERHGNPPEELRVSRELLDALGALPEGREFEYRTVRLYLDLNLDGDVVELA